MMLRPPSISATRNGGRVLVKKFDVVKIHVHAGSVAPSVGLHLHLHPPSHPQQHQQEAPHHLKALDIFWIWGEGHLRVLLHV